MALMECYECEAEISDKALSCPHCGAPKLVVFTEVKRNWGIIGAVLIMVIIVFAIFFNTAISSADERKDFVLIRYEAACDCDKMIITYINQEGEYESYTSFRVLGEDGNSWAFVVGVFMSYEESAFLSLDVLQADTDGESQRMVGIIQVVDDETWRNDFGGWYDDNENETITLTYVYLR
jgi:hypothetical protein